MRTKLNTQKTPASLIHIDLTSLSRSGRKLVSTSGFFPNFFFLTGASLIKVSKRSSFRRMVKHMSNTIYYHQFRPMKRILMEEHYQENRICRKYVQNRRPEAGHCWRQSNYPMAEHFHIFWT